MNQRLAFALLSSLLLSCAHAATPAAPPAGKGGAATPTPAPPSTASACLGSTALGAEQAASFQAVDDAALLAKTLGATGKGGLCQGQVYQSKAATTVTLFRAYNSTNPPSQLGNWWSFQKPQGRIAEYRRLDEICYQWSPLDMLVQCTLQPGTKVVVGTGQSAVCSQYLTYPASATQQVYIADAATALSNCAVSYGEFFWK